MSQVAQCSMYAMYQIAFFGPYIYQVFSNARLCTPHRLGRTHQGEGSDHGYWARWDAHGVLGLEAREGYCPYLRHTEGHMHSCG